MGFLRTLFKTIKTRLAGHESGSVNHEPCYAVYGSHPLRLTLPPLFMIALLITIAVDRESTWKYQRSFFLLVPMMIDLSLLGEQMFLNVTVFIRPLLL